MMMTQQRVPPVSDRLMSGPQLAKLGVQILNRYDLELQCLTCGERWSPRPHPDGRLPRGYWKCPNRCNW